MMSIYSPIKLIKKEILSFDRFLSGEIEFVNYPLPNEATKGKDVMSFGEYVRSVKKIPVIKINNFHFQKFTDVHVFIHNTKGKSFNWHRDQVNVVLYVLQGQKKVYTKNKVVTLNSGEFVKIPKGKLHYVTSSAKTIALSIGLSDGKFNLFKNN